MKKVTHKAELTYWSRQLENLSLLGGAVAAWFGVTGRALEATAATLWWAVLQALAFFLLKKSLGKK